MLGLTNAATQPYMKRRPFFGFESKPPFKFPKNAGWYFLATFLSNS